MFVQLLFNYLSHNNNIKIIMHSNAEDVPSQKWKEHQNEMYM